MQQTSSHLNLRFVFISIFIHFLILHLLQNSQSFFLSQHIPEKQTIEIELEPTAATKLTKQVVETVRVQKSKTAVEDAFLSEQTQTVEKQTRAKEVASFRMAKQGGAVDKKAEKKSEMHKIGLTRDYKPLGNLGPGQTAASNDYLKPVAEGSQTLLNTKEFAFYSFYQRVRQQLEQFWEPSLRDRLDKMINRGRTIASDREHSTRLMVVLNKEGVITKIQVENTSGLIDLDEVAIEAFNKAGPFPNPPSGMVEIDGKVRVEWEFVLRT